MMRWAEWRNAMKKGDRETATHNSFTSPSGTAPSQPKVISESGETGSTIPTCLRQESYAFSPTANAVSRSRSCKAEDSHAKRIKLAAPRGISSPFVGTELLAGWLAGCLCLAQRDQ